MDVTSPPRSRPQLSCYITRTTAETHRIIRDNLHETPKYGGWLPANGPRYCPSIEDKIVRFADKDSHQIFLEVGCVVGSLVHLISSEVSYLKCVMIFWCSPLSASFPTHRLNSISALFLSPHPPPPPPLVSLNSISAPFFLPTSLSTPRPPSAPRSPRPVRRQRYTFRASPQASPSASSSSSSGHSLA